jgi:hypothetical protein
MDSVDWAMNAAQINRDIRLANEHLPPGMQVRPNIYVVVVAQRAVCTSSPLMDTPDGSTHHAPHIIGMQHDHCEPAVQCLAHIRQVSAIELPACERPFAFSPEHDPSSPASDSVPANGPFAAMSGSRCARDHSP